MLHEVYSRVLGGHLQILNSNGPYSKRMFLLQAGFVVMYLGCQHSCMKDYCA